VLQAWPAPSQGSCARIEALSDVEPSGLFECALACLLAAYKRRLQEIVKTTPAWVSEKTLSPSECGKFAPPVGLPPRGAIYYVRVTRRSPAPGGISRWHYIGGTGRNMRTNYG
jgi:hypothetical protein